MATLAPYRTAHTYVAGGAALNQRWPRLSDDIDIFQHLRGDLAEVVAIELDALRAAGFAVEVVVETRDTVEVIIRDYGSETRVQWFDDLDASLHFFPAVADEDLGFRLHQADNSVNKVLCAARRQRAARDAVDLALIVEHYAPLGPIVWAAAGKATAVNQAQADHEYEDNPLRLIQHARANAFGYADEEIRTVSVEKGHEMGRGDIRRILGPALDAAYAYCEEIAPVNFEGHLFVDQDDRPVEADVDSLDRGDARGIPITNFGPGPTVD
ncbi:MAG TPA: hypothetical protein VGA50_19585 [Kiloniellales bacterium]